MRYFFHLENETSVVIDSRGRDFDRQADAINHASAMARDLGDDERWIGWSVGVIDERNAEVISVPVRASILSTK